MDVSAFLVGCVMFAVAIVFAMVAGATRQTESLASVAGVPVTVQVGGRCVAFSAWLGLAAIFAVIAFAQLSLAWF